MAQKIKYRINLNKVATNVQTDSKQNKRDLGESPKRGTNHPVKKQLEKK